jgi:type IV secretion system protein VirB10
MTTPPAEAPQQVMLPPVQSVPANYGEAPEKPEKTLKQQLEEQRKQLEMKSMFDDNIVSTSSQGPNRHGIAEPTAGPESSSSTNSSLGAILPGTPVPVSTKKTKLDFDPNQPTWILPEGTVINCALVNKLNGDFTGPVLVQVSTDVVAPSTRVVVIPQGSRIVGEASKVGSTGQERLAVAFHRLLIPTVSGPYSVSLDKATPGLDQEGATALKDKVNNHYASIFGASLAIGAIGGLAQIGNNYGANGYSSGGQFRNGVTESMAQSSMRVLDRFLNRMPTVEIRPGTRVNVILLEDLEVPAYASE